MPAIASSARAAPASAEAAPSPLLRRQRLDAARRGDPQPLEVAQPLAFGRELGLLGLARGRGVDLADLPLEQVELAVAGARPLAQGRQLRAQVALARMDLRVRRAALRLLGPAEAVEDLELRGGERELAVLVLAVEREQGTAHVAQVPRRGAAAVQVRARAPFGAHATREHQLVGVRREPVAELLAEPVGQRERALHVRLRRPGAHDARPRLAPEQQVERVREHGLAGPGLAREHVEPGRQAQLGPLDEQEVLDTQLFQHAARSTSRSRRTRASAGSR